MEVKLIRFDKKGNYKNHSYKSIEKGHSLYEYVNKKPGKSWNASENVLEFVFITDDLNTVPEDISNKYIKERHRLYFYVLDPSKDSVEIEFSRNMESYIDKWLIERKLKKYKVLHSLRDENDIFHFGSNVSSFDNMYFVTDEINDNLAKHTLYDELRVQHIELLNEVSFIEKMMKVTGGEHIQEELDQKQMRANLISHIDSKDEDDIEIEEYVVEKNIFFSTITEFFGGFKKIFRKEKKAL